MKFLNNSKLRKLSGQPRLDYLELAKTRREEQRKVARAKVGKALAEEMVIMMNRPGVMRLFLERAKPPKHKNMPVYKFGEPLKGKL